MPGYNLEVKEQAVTGIKATEPSEDMNVIGTLELTIANNGIVPTLVIAQVSEFKIGEHVILEDEVSSVGVVTSEGTAEFEFDTTSSDQKFKESIAQACLSETLPVSMLDVSATGRAMLTGAFPPKFIGTIDGKVESCDIETRASTPSELLPPEADIGDGGEVPPPPGEEPPNEDPPDDGGDGPIGNPPPEDDPSDISGPIRVERQETNEWTLENVQEPNVGRVDYEWSFGDGNSVTVPAAEGGETVSHSYTNAGTYRILAQAVALGTGLERNVIGEDELDVEVERGDIDLEPGQIEGPAEPVLGQEAEYSYVDEGEYGISVQRYWSFSDTDENEVGQTITHTFEEAGEQQITCEVREIGGAGTVTLEEDTVTVNVQDNSLF